jgi:hypothetical protein
MTRYAIEPAEVRTTVTLVAADAAGLETEQTAAGDAVSSATAAAVDPVALTALGDFWDSVGLVLPRVSQHAHDCVQGVLTATSAYLDADVQMATSAIAASGMGQP